jgi:hypothetical protein
LLICPAEFRYWCVQNDLKWAVGSRYSGGLVSRAGGSFLSTGNTRIPVFAHVVDNLEAIAGDRAPTSCASCRSFVNEEILSGVTLKRISVDDRNFKKEVSCVEVLSVTMTCAIVCKMGI